MPIERVIITDVDERHAPPSDDVLEVSVVDTDIFLAIGKYEEDNKSNSFKVKADVAVDAITLLQLLFTLLPDSERYFQRVAARERNPLA